MTHPAGRPSVLIVDDDPMLRMDIAEMVSELGFAVCEAENVAAALRHLERDADRTIMVVTDIAMPGSRNGLTLANHIRYMWPHIAMLVVSGSVTPLAEQLPEHVPFAPKPVSRQALAEHLPRVVTA